MTYIRKAAQIISPLVVVVCAATGVAVTEATASVSQAHRVFTRAASVACQTEVQVGSRHYRYVHLRRDALKAGARLRTAAHLQCEPDLVCRSDGSCSLNPNTHVHRIPARRLRGIEPRLAVIDVKSGRVYVNRQVFPINPGGKRLLRLLRQGGGPQRDRSQSPPDSYLLANDGKRMLLGMGDYCWSKSLGNQAWVQACATTVAPSRRFDIPLVTAEPSASLHTGLSFLDPTAVRVSLFRGGAIVYSEALPPSQSVTWTMPDVPPASYYLQITADRTLPGAPNDWVDYFARLHVVAQVGSG